MRIRTTLAAAAMLATLLPRSAPAQDAEPALPLRVRLAPGETVRLRRRAVSELAFDTGRRGMLSGNEALTDVTITGLPPTDDGHPRLTWRFDRIWGSSNGRYPGDFDSTRAELGDPLEEMEGALGGASLTLTLSPRGEIEQVDGIDAALAAATKRFAGHADVVSLLGRFVSRAAVREHVAWFLLPTPYPAEGSAWTDADVVPGGSIMRYEVSSDRSVTAVTPTEIEVDTTARVTLNPGRGEPEIPRAFKDGTPDSRALRTTCRISRADGLPIRHEVDLDVVSPVPDELGPEGAAVQRIRIVVERLDAAAADDLLPELRIVRPPEVTATRFIAERTRAMALASVERKGEADEAWVAAIGIAATLSRAEPDSLPRATAWFRAAQERAKGLGVDRTAELAAATQEVLAAIDARDRAGDAHTGRDRLYAYAELGRMQSNARDFASAAETLGQAAAVGREVVAGNPGNSTDAWGLGYTLVGLFRALTRTGDQAQAYEVAKEAHAILATHDARPEQVARVSWDIAHMTFRRSKDAEALALLERAQAEATEAVAENPRAAGLVDRIAKRLVAFRQLASGSKPADAQQAIELALLLMEVRRHPEALAHFEAAFADAALRAELPPADLYNGACTAALVHANADGEEKTRLEALAIDWLTPYAAHLRARFAAAKDDAERARIEAELAWFRTGDPDLASLRDLPAFQALFAE